MRVMSVLAAITVATALAAVPVAANITVAMDKQINVGMIGTAQSPEGDAIYTPWSGFESPRGPVTFETDGGVGFTRHGLPGGGWYYLYLDTTLAGLGTIDLSGAGSSISFDARYFQDPQTNTNLYGDAPIFVRAYEYDAGGNAVVGYKDFSIVWAVQSPWNNPRYPDWSRATVDVNGPGAVTGAWTGKVNRVRWYGTDWAGHGQDFIDVKNVTFATQPAIPEPGTMALLLTGALPFVTRLRRRKI